MQALVLYQKMGFLKNEKKRRGKQAARKQRHRQDVLKYPSGAPPPPQCTVYLSLCVCLSLSRLLLLECSGRVFKKKGSKWKMKDGRWELSTAAGEIFPPPPPARRSSEQRGGGGKEPHARRGRFVFVTFTSVFPSDPFLGWFVLLLVSRTGLSVNKKASERFSLALW